MRFCLTCAVVVTVAELGSRFSSAGQQVCVQAAGRSVVGNPLGTKGSTTVTSPVAVTHVFEELRAILAVFSPLTGCGRMAPSSHKRLAAAWPKAQMLAMSHQPERHVTGPHPAQPGHTSGFHWGGTLSPGFASFHMRLPWRPSPGFSVTPQIAT